LARGRQKNKASRAESLLTLESGTWLKKRTGRLPVALIYPNHYSIGVSSLGFQLVYSLLNSFDAVVCERFFLPEGGAPLRSFETGRPLRDFTLFFYSISFEHDYVNLARMLLAAEIPLFAEDRKDEKISSTNPLVIGGGVATFMNPEPLAPWTDLFLLGEAEELLPPLFSLLDAYLSNVTRSQLLEHMQRDLPGAYVPSLYTPLYDEEIGLLTGLAPQGDYPASITKAIVVRTEKAAHSQLLSPKAEFANLYVTELGRGCSRGCRFCAAGFIYRPPRLWDADAVIKGLEERGESVTRIGLLGMEMADETELASLSSYLLESGCSLSFSSLRADRISGNLLQLLGSSSLKSVAIAPDGASERLRRVINKNLTEADILRAATRLVEAGLYKLKLYLMIGLPGETLDDLQEMIDLIKKVKKCMLPKGKERGRLCEISLSVNSFTPKPWTPFQFHSFGGLALDEGETGCAKEAIKSLKEKIRFLKDGLRKVSNVRLHHDKPEKVLFQAVLSKGDRRLASVLATMALHNIPWKQAMRKHDLTPEQYAVRYHKKDEYFAWNIVNHKISQEYLWQEYQKSFLAKTTQACDTRVCRKCGVCGD
jgi:radical SAM superfamily enzyme YgiQ (UPF0313 family)